MKQPTLKSLRDTVGLTGHLLPSARDCDLKDWVCSVTIPPTWSSLSSAPELSPWWNSPFELFYWTFLCDSKPLRSCEVPLPPGFAGRREWPAFVILCSDEPLLSMFPVSSLSLPCCSWPQNFCGFVHRFVQIHTQIFCLEKLVKCVRDILTVLGYILMAWN